MSTTISFHGPAAARADRLESGTVYVALTDDAHNTVNVFLATRAQAGTLVDAFTEARDLLAEDGAS